MLTDDEIMTAITDAQAGHTSRGTLLAIGRAVEAKVLAKLGEPIGYRWAGVLIPAADTHPHHRAEGVPVYAVRELAK